MILRDTLKSLLDRWERRLEAAGGDPIEAIHGHVCGADCWHRQDPQQLLGLNTHVCGMNCPEHGDAYRRAMIDASVPRFVHKPRKTR